MRHLIALILLVPALAACRDDTPIAPSGPVDPPVDSFESIPDAPVSGIIRGVAFTLQDARYIVDRRPDHAHTDILLSAGRTDAPCGEAKPKGAPTVWLRFRGSDAVERQQTRISAITPGSWSVHYQIQEDGRWFGAGDGAALLNIRSVEADGRITGDLAVCFADGKKSCVKGSFDARYCAVSIDEPVRGSFPIEDTSKLPPPKPPAAVPDGGTPPDGGAAADGGAPPKP